MIGNRMRRRPLLRPLAEGKGRVSLVLVLLSAILILLFGQYLIWAGQAPLAPAGWRTLVAALLLLAWAVYYGLRYVVPRQTAADLDRQGMEARLEREARQIHRHLTRQRWRDSLGRRPHIRRYLWILNVADADLESALCLSGRRRLIHESHVLGVRVVEIGSLRCLVARETGDSALQSRQDSVTAILARVLYSGTRPAPDAVLWQVKAQDLIHDENQCLMQLGRLNEAVASRTATPVPLMIWVTGLDTLQGSEVVRSPRRREVSGFDFDTGADQLIVNWHQGAQVVFERTRGAVHDVLASETDPAVRMRGLRFLAEIHELLNSMERVLFRLGNDVAVNVLKPVTFALGECAQRFADASAHPVLARIPLSGQGHERARWRKWVLGLAWLSAATVSAAFATISWQDRQAAHSILLPLSDAVDQQAEADRGAALASLRSWDSLRSQVAAAMKETTVSLDALDGPLSAGYASRLVRALSEDGEAWILGQVRQADRNYQTLSRLSRMVAAFEGQGEWSDTLRQAWLAPWADEPAAARWLNDYIALGHKAAMPDARAALLEAMSEVPLEEQLIARLLDEEMIARMGYVDTETLLGREARNWLRDDRVIRLPRYFTAAGYHTAFAPGLESLLDELEQESRQIQGESAHFPRDALKAAAENAYADAVQKAWSAVLDQIGIRRPRNDELADYLAWLGSRSDSPVRHLFESVVTLTDYSLTTTASRVSVEKALRLASLGTGSAARLAVRAKRLQTALGENAMPADKPLDVPPQLKEVQLRFRDVQQWLPGDTAAGRWDALADVLKKLADELREQADLSPSEQFTLASRQLTSDTAFRDYRTWMRTARSLPRPAREWVVASLARYRGSQAAAVKSQIAQAYGVLQKVWHQQFEGRYPFSADGGDVDMASLERFFGPKGDLSRFIETYVQPFTIKNNGVYRNKGGAGALGFSSRALAMFAWADAMRNTLFDESGAFHVGMTWRPQYLDANLRKFELSVYDESLSYRHGPLLRKSTTWTAGDDPERAVVKLVDYNGLTYHEAFEGPWALHRMFMRFRPRQISSSRYQVEFEVQGRRAVYDLSFDKPDAWSLLAQARSIEFVPLFD